MIGTPSTRRPWRFAPAPLATPLETVAPFDSDTHAQLRAKHPTSSMHPSQIEPPDGFPSLILIGEDVADAVRSFPAGSSGGPDGLKPIHLSDMMACQEVKHELIAVVIEF